MTIVSFTETSETYGSDKNVLNMMQIGVESLVELLVVAFYSGGS